MSLFCSTLTLANVKPQLSRELVPWLETEMKVYNISGVSIAVIHDYKIKWLKALGMRDKKKMESVTVNTLFQAASISKPITAVAAVETFQDKNLSLNADINSILQNWQIPNSEYTANREVTMRLLLSHSAGVTGFRYKGYTRKDKLPTLLQVLNGVPPANTPSVKMVSVPGKKSEYSPAGYTIIQQALTDIYDKPFDQVMQELVLTPLNMRHSTFVEPLPRKYLNQIARPYLPDGSLMPNSPLTFIAAAAGGMWSTPADLAKFVIAVQETLAGKSSLGISSKTINDMMRPVVNHNWGMGFEVNINKYGEEMKGEGDYFRHGGFNSGYLSMIVGSKKGGNGIAIMINTAPYMDAKDVPQYEFIAKVIKHIAIVEGWD